MQSNQRLITEGRLRRFRLWIGKWKVSCMVHLSSSGDWFYIKVLNTLALPDELSFLIKNNYVQYGRNQCRLIGDLPLGGVEGILLY